MRRGLLLGLLFASAITGLLPQSTRAENESAKDRAKWRLAALAAARQVLDDLKKPGALQEQDRVLLVEALNDAMRRNVAAHARRDDSRRLCAELASDLRRQAVEQRLVLATARAGEQSTLPVKKEDVIALLGREWTDTLNQSLRKFTDTDLDPIFKDARGRAVGLLRQNIGTRLKFPSIDEANALLTNAAGTHTGNSRLTDEDEMALRLKLATQAIPDNRPCFEELRTAVGDYAHQIAGELRSQYTHQLDQRDALLTTGIPADKRTQAVILDAVKEALSADLTANAAKPAAADINGNPIPHYALFALVQDSLPAAAAQAEEQRFNSFIATTPVLALDAESLAKAIRAEPERHATAAAGQRVFLEAYRTSGKASVSSAYAAGAVPVSTPATFSGLIDAAPALASALDERVKAELGRHLPAARQTVSDEQFTKYFAAADKAVPLTGKALERLQEAGNARVTTLDDAAQILDVSKPNAARLLEETAQRAIALAERKAQEGYNVLIAQLAIVKALEASRLAQLKQDVERRRAFKEIRAEWLAAAETAWQSDARARSTPYGNLLDGARTTLDKAVRQLYDSVRENPAVAVTATPVEPHPATETETDKKTDVRNPPSTPEEQPTQDKPTPDKKPSPKAGGAENGADSALTKLKADRSNAPHGILLLVGQPHNVTTARLISRDAMELSTVTFNAGKPESSSEQIFTAFKPHLETLLTGVVAQWKQEHSGLGILKRRTPPKLKLFVVIESNDVRHRMSLLLRDHVETFITDWNARQIKGTPAAELDWKVGLTFDVAGTGQ